MPEWYGIYEALREDHEHLRQLLATLPDAGADASARFVELSGELVRHERAEERIFYEPLLRSTTGHEEALDAFEEHHVADLIVGELGQGDPADETWHAKARVLRETVEHHIAEEEDRVFRAARQAMDTDWAADAAKRFLSEKALMQRPS